MVSIQYKPPIVKPVKPLEVIQLKGSGTIAQIQSQYRQKDLSVHVPIYLDKVPRLKSIKSINYVLSNIRFYVPEDPNNISVPAKYSYVDYSFDTIPLSIDENGKQNIMSIKCTHDWFNVTAAPLNPSIVKDYPDGTCQYELGWVFHMTTDTREYIKWGGMGGQWNQSEYYWTVNITGTK